MASTTHPSRSVRRSLFGPVDHEQLRRELRQRLKEMSEQDSRRWNFNFQADTPLDGRFQWEEVPLDCAAALYQESADRPGATDTDTDTEDRLSAADQENCSSISNTRLRPAEETPVRRKRARSRSVDKSGGKCARITGEERRRRSTTTTTTETKCAQSAFHEGGAETALCKTIR
ncbi:cyclin dependent kinase inhibitor 1Ca isoform X2 [Nelusetta ayraudi]|uniref:cyclin dependent kinase inhibitor 1Ca isoform X2 n=1 Tax=Nelusetta ayraudi TaxID=303726 RepID=UPI003F7069B0